MEHSRSSSTAIGFSHETDSNSSSSPLVLMGPSWGKVGTKFIDSTRDEVSNIIPPVPQKINKSQKSFTIIPRATKFCHLHISLNSRENSHLANRTQACQWMLLHHEARTVLISNIKEKSTTMKSQSSHQANNDHNRFSPRLQLYTI